MTRPCDFLFWEIISLVKNFREISNLWRRRTRNIMNGRMRQLWYTYDSEVGYNSSVPAIINHPTQKKKWTWRSDADRTLVQRWCFFRRFSFSTVVISYYKDESMLFNTKCNTKPAARGAVLHQYRNTPPPSHENKKLRQNKTMNSDKAITFRDPHFLAERSNNNNNNKSKRCWIRSDPVIHTAKHTIRYGRDTLTHRDVT